jgi:hypothetical protein
MFLIDFKTSQSLHTEHELQVSAYKQALQQQDYAKDGVTNPYRLAILQLGYKRNKLGYKFTEVEDDFPAFLAAHTIFTKEVGRQDPPRRTYPISLSLNIDKQ